MNLITDHIFHLLYQEAAQKLMREPNEKPDVFERRTTKYVERRAKQIAVKLYESTK